MHARSSGLTQMHGGDAAQTMGHDDGRALIGQQHFFQSAHPRITVGHQPVLLLYAHGLRQLFSPQALPVAGA